MLNREHRVKKEKSACTKLILLLGSQGLPTTLQTGPEHPHKLYEQIKNARLIGKIFAGCCLAMSYN